MASLKDRVALASSNCNVAIYKGHRVDVFMADKTEISLTRQDLVELVNVRVSFVRLVFDFCPLTVCVFCNSLQWSTMLHLKLSTSFCW